MRAAAFAKVNLGLRVGSVREDGFHPIRSLFQSISWSDRLELVAGDEDGIAGWNGEEVPDGDANLARRAVVAMREAVGSTASIYLRLQKRIPVAAGLGGGSADAAAALHLARRMLEAPVEKVAELAAGLGSDVPFCITGGTALVTGRGDVAQSLRPLLGYGMALRGATCRVGDPAGLPKVGRLGRADRPGVRCDRPSRRSCESMRRSSTISIRLQ